MQKLGLANGHILLTAIGGHDASDLHGNVIVSEVQACERGQWGDMFREGSDLVVSEL